MNASTLSNTASRFGFKIPQNRVGRPSVRKDAGLPAWGLVLFSLPFLLIGVFLVATSLGWITEESRRMHAPAWVLTVTGSVFMLVAPLVWSLAFRELRHKRLLRERQREHPSEPAMQDYPWDPRAVESPRWMPFFQSLGVACGLTLFLSIFNWWAFLSGKGPVMVQLLVGIFDLILLFFWWKSLEALIRGLKFGATRLEWAGFPQHPDAVRLRWSPGSGMKEWTSAVFTLRCIRETHEVVRTHKGHQTRVSHEELWAQSDNLGRAPVVTGVIDLCFNAPDSVPGSALRAEAPLFWELEVELDTPGVNFHHRYLVPVYRGGCLTN